MSMMTVLTKSLAWQLSKIALAIIILTASARDSFAQTVPYKTKGKNAVYTPSTGDYGGFGVGTHMGKHSFFGNVTVKPDPTDPNNPLKGTFVTTPDTVQEVTAADGSKFFSKFSGKVQLKFMGVVPNTTIPIFTARWEGQFVVVGGTGRFANVKPAAQPLQVIAVNHPFTFLDQQWYFDWEIDGQIILK
jgi:hypothetical protein